MAAGASTSDDCSVTITGSTFANNAAGNSNSNQSLGGAINATGIDHPENLRGACSPDNTAVAADSGYEGAAAGGAIYMSNYGATMPAPSAI